MLDDKKISDLIRRLAKARNWSDTYASKMATGSGDLLSRLDAGSGVTLRRANAIIKRASTHWPPDLAWPSDIPRPKPGQSPDRPVKEQAA